MVFLSHIQGEQVTMPRWGDWVYAMPAALHSGTPSSTTLLRSSPTPELALSISRRLSQRFRQPVYLGLDLARETAEATDGDAIIYLERAIVLKLTEASLETHVD